jgi:hypothetical protein
MPPSRFMSSVTPAAALMMDEGGRFSQVKLRASDGRVVGRLSQQGALAAGFGRWAAAAGCQMVAGFAASRGLWGRFPEQHRSDRTSQEDPGPATTVFGTVVRLGDTYKAGIAKECRSKAHLAEGVGLEPTSPCGQRFSSYELVVLAPPA